MITYIPCNESYHDDFPQLKRLHDIGIHAELEFDTDGQEYVAFYAYERWERVDRTCIYTFYFTKERIEAIRNELQRWRKMFPKLPAGCVQEVTA